MARIKDCALVVAGITLVVQAIAGGAGAAFADNIRDDLSRVLVINSPAQPIPVAAQGTTTVAGSFNIANTAANPIPVTLAQPVIGTAPIPFQTQLSLQGSPASLPPVLGSASFTVPAGHRLHIENVTVAGTNLLAEATSPDPESIVLNQATVSTTVNGAAVTHTLQTTGSFAAVSSLVSLYADAGSTVTVSAVLNGGPGPAQASISGELSAP